MCLEKGRNTGKLSEMDCWQLEQSKIENGVSVGLVRKTSRVDRPTSHRPTTAVVSNIVNRSIALTCITGCGTLRAPLLWIPQSCVNVGTPAWELRPSLPGYVAVAILDSYGARAVSPATSISSITSLLYQITLPPGDESAALCATTTATGKRISALSKNTSRNSTA